MSEPFRLLLRVRYAECDAQSIVFNARWGDYLDVASSEYTRVLFGGVDPSLTGLDWHVVKQTIEWYAPARFDDVVDIRVRTVRVGTTSFTLGADFRRFADQTRLASAELVCVMVEPTTGAKKVVEGEPRAALERGAPGILVDHAAVLP